MEVRNGFLSHVTNPVWSELRVLILLTTAILGPCGSGVEAAPVTLRFEGAIGPPRDGTFPISLPFAITEGDPISGTFSVDPVDSPLGLARFEALMNHPWVLQIQSVELRSDSLIVQADNGLASLENPIPEDRLVMNCLGVGTSCQPSTIPGFPNVDWSFSWTFIGDANVLNGADIPGDVATWNGFSPSTILVSFQDRSTGRGTGFQAIINSFAIVPEPAAITLAIYSFALFTASVYFVRRKRALAITRSV